MEVVEYTSTALQTILSSWKEIGYDDLQFTEKQKNLVTLLHNLCDPIIEQERAEHKRLIEEKARLSKLIQALSNTLETQEFEHPPEGTLLVIVDEMTNRQIFLQRVRYSLLFYTNFTSVWKVLNSLLSSAEFWELPFLPL